MTNDTPPIPSLSVSKIIPILTSKMVKDTTLNFEIKLNTIINSSQIKIPIYFHSKDVENCHDKKSNDIRFIYCARVGQNYNAHVLAKKVLDSGNIFIGEKEQIKKCFPEDSENILKHKLFFPVKNSEKALCQILQAAFKIDEKNYITVAVTGTNGKTSVTQMAGNLWHELSHETILKIGTLGVQMGKRNLQISHVTTPDTPSFFTTLGAAEEENIKNIILEFTSHGLKENRLENWPIQIAVFTNLTQDHLDFHKTMNDYRNSKLKLFKQHLSPTGSAVININNLEWVHFVEAAKGQKRNLILVGNTTAEKEIVKKFKPFFNSIRILSIEKPTSNLNGLAGKLILKNDQHKIIEESSFTTQLIGEFQFENILCSVGVSLALKKSLTKICHYLSKIQPIPGRLEKVLSSKVCDSLPTVLVDYAHTPDALEKAILTCKKSLPKEGKLITIFGCGGDRDKTKRPLMGKVAFENSNISIVTSDNPRTENPDSIIDEILNSNPLSSSILKEPDRKLAIEKGIQLATKNDLVLIAGKGHEDYQIIGTTKYPFSDVLVVESILEKI
jgi:UDP-N-acetylmuramoyl-L-alanyl-D-glutamate--2,6-diaminopimelate ligase